MDQFDYTILNHLQVDAAFTNADLGERAHLSASQISRRRARLEAEGYIKGYRAEVNAEKLGFEIDVFIRVTLTAHSDDTAEEFGKFLKSFSQVRSAYALAGSADYLLHIKTRSLRDLSKFINRQLLPHANVGEVRSEIVLERVKENAPLAL
jgi:Lrp/AsnC family leucine-responsive transcriptional regulator